MVHAPCLFTLLPAGVRKAAGFEPDTRLLVRVHEGGVELMTAAGAVCVAQAIVRWHVEAGTSLTDELSRERRTETRREVRRRR